MDGEFYTVKELANYLKVHPRTILNHIRSGDIRAFKIGKDWRVPKESLQEWLDDKLKEF